MEKKIFQKRGSPTLKNKHHPPSQKENKRKYKPKKAHRKGFWALNKFAFSRLFLFWINVILFHVYSLGVKESLRKNIYLRRKLLKNNAIASKNIPGKQIWWKGGYTLSLKATAHKASQLFRQTKDLPGKTCHQENFITDTRRHRIMKKSYNF